MTVGCGSRQVGIIGLIVQGGSYESNRWPPGLQKAVPNLSCLLWIFHNIYISCFVTTKNIPKYCQLLLNLEENLDSTTHLILWHLLCSPFCLNAVIPFPLGGPTVIALLTVNLHGSSLADDKQAADGSGGRGAAAERQHTWTVIVQLLQSHWAASAKRSSLS